MSVLSVQFLALATLTAIGFRALSGRAIVTARPALLATANVWFLASVIGTWTDLLPLAGFLASSWLTLLWLRHKPRAFGLGLGVAWTVALFVLLKQYSFLPMSLTFEKPLVTVGLSYVLFRVLHVMIDVGAGAKVAGLTALNYFNYTCGFFTFVSGPIQRFEDFVCQLEKSSHEPLTGEELHSIGRRAAFGMVKLVLLAPIAMHAHEWAAEALRSEWGRLAAVSPTVLVSFAALGYLVFLYWNFSGYTDVVIAAGRMSGFSLPENFSRPFSSPNFIVLWSRWHITLSDWFRIYLFNPIVAWLTRLQPDAKYAPYYGVLGFLGTFFVMGIWHGTTGIFLLYGLLLGAGVSLNKLYQVQMRAWLGKRKLQRLQEGFVYERLCNGLCIAFFALALSSFWLQPRDLIELPHVLGAAELLGAIVVSAGITIALRLAHDGVTWCVARPAPASLLLSPWAAQAWTALLVLLLLLHAGLSHSALPPFVYAGF